LAQLLDGRPVAHHAATTLGRIAFGNMIAVVGQNDLGLAAFGFETRRTVPDAPLSASIICGVTALLEVDCDACLIALADMPYVPEAHFRALMVACAGHATATNFAGRMTVPAVFSRELFPALLALSGDRGAAAMLSNAPHVTADPTWMTDIDTPADLVRLQTIGSLDDQA